MPTQMALSWTATAILATIGNSKLLAACEWTIASDYTSTGTDYRYSALTGIQPTKLFPRSASDLQ